MPRLAKSPVLVGIDFAFAHPFRVKQSADLSVDDLIGVDTKSYFPYAEDSQNGDRPMGFS